MVWIVSIDQQRAHGHAPTLALAVCRVILLVVEGREEEASDPLPAPPSELRRLCDDIGVRAVAEAIGETDEDSVQKIRAKLACEEDASE